MRVHPASSSWLVAVSGQARDRDRREPKMGRVGRGFKSLARLPACPGNHRATLLSSFELGLPSVTGRFFPGQRSLCRTPPPVRDLHPSRPQRHRRPRPQRASDALHSDSQHRADGNDESDEESRQSVLLMMGRPSRPRSPPPSVECFKAAGQGDPEGIRRVLGSFVIGAKRRQTGFLSPGPTAADVGLEHRRIGIGRSRRRIDGLDRVRFGNTGLFCLAALLHLGHSGPDHPIWSRIRASRLPAWFPCRFQPLVSLRRAGISERFVRSRLTSPDRSFRAPLALLGASCQAFWRHLSRRGPAPGPGGTNAKLRRREGDDC